jgi:hypothetical protein
MTTLSLWSYDVWGNEADGFEVNDRCCIDRDLWNGEGGEVPALSRDAEAYLAKIGEFSPCAAIDWTASGGGTYEITDRCTGKPLGQFVVEG